MSTTTTPAPARTDAAARPAPPQAAVDRRTARRTGVAVAAGSAVWSASMLTVGANPSDSLGITISDLAALPFQASLFALVRLQLRTGATGTTRVARGMLRVEFVLLALATAWTLLHGLVPAFRDDLWLAVLDVFWPLSMLGMAVIGVKVALAGRWRGAVRLWPCVAESWAPVSVPVFVLFGGGVASVVGGVHLLVGYVLLGVLIARRPELTGAR